MAFFVNPFINLQKLTLCKMHKKAELSQRWPCDAPYICHCCGIPHHRMVLGYSKAAHRLFWLYCWFRMCYFAIY